MAMLHILFFNWNSITFIIIWYTYKGADLMEAYSCRPKLHQYSTTAEHGIQISNTLTWISFGSISSQLVVIRSVSKRKPDAEKRTYVIFNLCWSFEHLIFLSKFLLFCMLWWDRKSFVTIVLHSCGEPLKGNQLFSLATGYTTIPQWTGYWLYH